VAEKDRSLTVAALIVDLGQNMPDFHPVRTGLMGCCRKSCDATLSGSRRVVKMAGMTGQSIEPKPPGDAGVGLYVHVPFCETKCGYCDFYSVAVKERDTAPLVARVKRELDRRVREAAAPVRTIFCGGGTPTILPVEQLAGLLESINRAAPAAFREEFTVEANPATVDDEKAALLVAMGVSRVSMGAQSFHPSELTTLERLHSPDDIPPSVATLRRHGISQINLDLIFGIPGQTMSTWADSLRRAIDLGPEHIACYGLTYEPATRLTALRQVGRIRPCDEDLEADMYLYTVDTLAAAGYRQYETSNYARPGCECRHNLMYWRNEPYIGVGPSAAGCVGGRRYKNVADVAGYVRMMDEAGHAEAESEIVEGETLMLEMILMQLRLVEGLSIAAFRAGTGEEPVELFDRDGALSRLVETGLLAVSDSYIAFTRQGRLVGDWVMKELAGAIGARSTSLAVLR